LIRCQTITVRPYRNIAPVEISRTIVINTPSDRHSSVSARFASHSASRRHNGEIAEGEEVAADASSPDLSTALPEIRPGDRERLGNARPSEDEAPAGSAPRDGDHWSGQSSQLADFISDPAQAPRGDGEHPTKRERPVVSAGSLAECQMLIGIQMGQLTEPIQSGSSPASASATSDVGMAIPTFLRRGHADCAIDTQPRQEEPSADA
jgi:hypothetical protein